MSRRRMSARPAAATILVGVAAATCLGGCSGDGDDGTAAASTAPASSVAADDAVTPPRVVGAAEVSVGERSWELDLSSCGTSEGRFTAQGSDEEGSTIVVTFLLDGTGSVIVSQGADSWATGPAGGTEAPEVEISETSLNGSGAFVASTTASDDEATPPADPVPGTFAATCDA